MSMVWITRVANYLPDTTITLRQNDPTYHPVINGHQYNKNDPIVIPPGVAQDCKWFVIPWANSGRLQVQGPDGMLQFNIGPTSLGASDDSLRMLDAHENMTNAASMGPRGAGWVASVDLHLVFNENGMLWQVWDANRVGHDILEKADKIFMDVAPGLLGALLKKIAHV
jgi:hypothetical protein